MDKSNLKKGQDFIGVGIIYFCHDENGRWDIGGGLEFGDNVENTLKKEIMEEYCTDVLDFEFLGFRDVHRVHNSNNTHWIALDFKVLVDSKKVKNGEPHKFDEIAWFRLDNLPDNLHSQLPKFFELYRNKLF